MKVLGIVGASHSGGRTDTLVQAVLDSAAEQGAETELLNLSEYNVAFADGTRSTDWTGDTKEVVSKIESADAFILGTPVYREAYTAMLKNALDLTPRGVWDGPTHPMQGKAVGVVATGTLPEHYLSIDSLHGMLPGFFASYVVPLGVYANAAQFAEDGTIEDDKIFARANSLGKAIVTLSAAIEASEVLRDVAPQI